jgi:hypothetical protein
VSSRRPCALASAAIPAAGSLTNPVAVGQYDLGVNNGTRFERRTITVPPGGATIDLRAFYDAPAVRAHARPHRSWSSAVRAMDTRYLHGTFMAGGGWTPSRRANSSRRRPSPASRSR